MSIKVEFNCENAAQFRAEMQELLGGIATIANTVAAAPIAPPSAEKKKKEEAKVVTIPAAQNAATPDNIPTGNTGAAPAMTLEDIRSVAIKSGLPKELITELVTKHGNATKLPETDAKFYPAIKEAIEAAVEAAK